MMGWTAATGELGAGAWLLGAVLFAWQMPHFLALAWLYRDDYARGGFRMLPVLDGGGRVTGLMAVLYSLALVPLGLLSALLGVVGWTAAIASVGLGVFLVVCAVRLDRERSDLSARKLFLASLVYLPLLLAFMVLDRARGPEIGPAPAEAAVSRIGGASGEGAGTP